MQSLSLLGMPRLLAEFFGGPTQFGAAGGRGSSTLGLPAATADLMMFNLAIVTGLWTRYRRHRLALTAAAALMLFGTLGAGEFAGAIGLVVGLVCIAIVSGSARLLALFVPAVGVGGWILWPVIEYSSPRLPVGFWLAGQLARAAAEPGDLFLAQAVLGLEFRAGRPPIGCSNT